MSHFTVLVIGDNPQKQLAPYQENNMDDCPKEYLKFNETETEYKKEFETDTRQDYYPQRSEVDQATYDKLAACSIHDSIEHEISGSFLTFFKKKEIQTFYVKDNTELEKIYFKIEKFHDPKAEEAGQCTEGKVTLIRVDPPVDIPFTEYYTDFDTYMKEWHGYDSRDEKEGKYGYWENPNAKWDWYQLGGRWTGFFKAKGHGGVMGEKSLLDNRPQPEGRLDQGTKAQIDFDGMYNDAADAARAFYNEVKDLFGGSIPVIIHNWEDLVSEVPDDSPTRKADIDLKRAEYAAQDAMVAYEELKKKYPRDSEEYNKLLGSTQHFLHGFHWGGKPAMEQFLCTEDEFVGKAMSTAVSPYAIIKDGKWYAQGEMGWWGMSSDEMSIEEWTTQIHKLIDEASDDTLFSLYDCHI